jgi:hypothetical protein
MTNQEPATSWAKALPERLASADSILSFYFSTSGRIALVHFAINGEEKGSFPIGIKDKSDNVWGLIDIYGNTTSIELVDPRIPIYNNLQNSVRSQSFARRSQSLGVIGHSAADDSEDDDGLYESMSGLTLVQHNEKREPQPQVYSKVPLSPLNFHRIRGCNIRLSNDRYVHFLLCLILRTCYNLFSTNSTELSLSVMMVNTVRDTPLVRDLCRSMRRLCCKFSKQQNFTPDH